MAFLICKLPIFLKNTQIVAFYFNALTCVMPSVSSFLRCLPTNISSYLFNFLIKVSQNPLRVILNVCWQAASLVLLHWVSFQNVEIYKASYKSLYCIRQGKIGIRVVKANFSKFSISDRFKGIKAKKDTLIIWRSILGYSCIRKFVKELLSKHWI